jgi:TRAP-type uncharacterized transport system substrate-binding protein
MKITTFISCAAIRRSFPAPPSAAKHFALMRSHFAGNAIRMTIGVQRLDPPWRAFKNLLRTTSGGLRGNAFRRNSRGTCITILAMGAAFALPSAAKAVPPPQPQETQPATPAAQTDNTPAPAEKARAPRRGVVRYDKPVFHHGHRVLWHGAWRNGQVAAKSGPTKTESAAAPAAAAPVGAHDILVLADGADPSATRMAVEFAQAMQSGGLHVKAVAGKTSAAALNKAVDGDTADLAIVPMDALGNSGDGSADKASDWRARAPYIARLASEPIALIAPRAIADIHQLADRKVNVAAADSATAASAAAVFSRLNIASKMTNEPLPDALLHLARGEIDAIFLVGAGDSKALADFGKDGRFHVVDIPYAPTLQALYCPMRLTSHDQASLIGAADKVDTIGVPMALLAIDATPDSPRANRIAPVADRLFAQFDQSVGTLRGSRWKDVNLAARIPGWPRFGVTQAWLDQNKGPPNAAVDTFRDAAERAASANEGPGGADSDKLYDSLMQLSGAAQ